MPSKSEAQRRLFAIAEHNPSQLYKKNRGVANLPKKTLHEFASKVDKGFYSHINMSSMRTSPIKTTGGLHMGGFGSMGMGRHMKGIKLPSLGGGR